MDYSPFPQDENMFALYEPFVQSQAKIWKKRNIQKKKLKRKKPRMEKQMTEKREQNPMIA